MSDDLESILRRVAAGELTPEAALSHLNPPAQNDAARSRSNQRSSDQTDHGPADPDRRADAAAPRAQHVEPVTSVRLKTSYRSVQVIADPAVAQIFVIGEHSIRHEGSTLQVSTTGPMDDQERSGGRDGSGSQGSGRFSFSDLPKTIAWARSWRDHQLIVRVNPALAIELDVTGADVKLTGFESGLRAHLVASSLKADKVHCEFDVEAFSSSIKLTAIPTGNSRLYCESSSARLSLPSGTDLKITATNRMGRLVLPERAPSTLPFEGETSEVTIGDGRAQLRLESVMSSVTVSAKDWGSVPA
jgi:hypothetical protein